MSEKFERVKYYYENGYWNLNQVKNAVAKNWITKEEYTLITGLEY